MTAKRTCAATQHDFDKFDDATIYCRKCGEQRVMDVQALIAKLPQPVYLPCPSPHYQPYWWGPATPRWTWTSPNISITTTDSTSVGTTYQLT